MRIKKIILATFSALLPIFAQAQDTVDADSTSAKESRLVFPNAFSPNNDGINDKYMAKEHENIKEFHAYIFNRWGQKLFEWTNIEDGWDGTYKGQVVKDGTYFVLVKAKGADGKQFNIRKDVNILTGFYEEGRTTR